MSMPRPQDSILPAKKNVRAMSGFAGCEGCLPMRRSIDQSGGKAPAFQIISLSSYTLIWMGTKAP